MLAPKRVKWRRPHRKMYMGGQTKGGASIAYGEWGLQAAEAGWITDRQIEAARVAITRHVKRGGKLWIKIFPQKAITKKPAETRMGSGKGAPEFWVAVIKPGRIMFELAEVPEDIAKEALRLASMKLPIKCKLVRRPEGQPIATVAGGDGE